MSYGFKDASSITLIPMLHNMASFRTNGLKNQTFLIFSGSQASVGAINPADNWQHYEDRGCNSTCLCHRMSNNFSFHRDHFVNASSQWETTLQCNVVSHLLGAHTKWSLVLHSMLSMEEARHKFDIMCYWCNMMNPSKTKNTTGYQPPNF